MVTFAAGCKGEGGPAWPPPVLCSCSYSSWWRRARRRRSRATVRASSSRRGGHRLAGRTRRYVMLSGAVVRDYFQRLSPPCIGAGSPTLWRPLHFLQLEQPQLLLPRPAMRRCGKHRLPQHALTRHVWHQLPDIRGDGHQRRQLRHERCLPVLPNDDWHGSRLPAIRHRGLHVCILSDELRGDGQQLGLSFRRQPWGRRGREGRDFVSTNTDPIRRGRVESGVRVCVQLVREMIFVGKRQCGTTVSE